MGRVALLLLLVASGTALWLAGRERTPPVAAPVRPTTDAQETRTTPPAPDAAPRPAPTPAPPPEAAAPADPTPWVDGAGAPSRALVRASLEQALRDRLPAHKLSPGELDSLTDATLRLRESQEALRALPATPEHADGRRALRDAIGEATETYVELLDMTPAEFTVEAEPGAGLDAFDPGEPIPEPEFLGDPPR